MQLGHSHISVTHFKAYYHYITNVEEILLNSRWKYNNRKNNKKNKEKKKNHHHHHQQQ